jgi:hypothetical protein
MKIITKNRDYYDPMIAVYGRDEKIVYDRRGNEEISVGHKTNYYHSKDRPDCWDCRVFSICGEYFPVVVKNYGEEYRWLPEQMPKSIEISRKDYTELNAIHCFKKYYGKKSDLNTKHQQPVLLQHRSGISIPILAEWNFPKMIPADEMYNKIYTWLCWSIDNPPIPNNQTDKEKVVSHGFDVKKSFRPKIKD